LFQEYNIFTCSVQEVSIYQQVCCGDVASFEAFLVSPTDDLCFEEHQLLLTMTTTGTVLPSGHVVWQMTLKESNKILNI
jgi:hypothetical protein